MKTLLSLFIILFFSLTNAYAQRNLFRMYRYECSELFDLQLTKPKGFKVIDGLTPFKVNEKMNIGMVYRMMLESKSKDCLILFPYFSVDRYHRSTTKNMFYGELKAALNIDCNNELIKLDSAKYIRIIAKESMENYFNADTVYISKTPLMTAYRGVYNECIGINVLKKGHPSAMIKILFTEEGNKKEEEYLQILFKSIRYPDSNPEYNQEKIEKIHKKLRFKSMLHRKRYQTISFLYFDGM